VLANNTCQNKNDMFFIWSRIENANVADTMPKNVFAKLEREWRLIDPSRQKLERSPQPLALLKRLKISRFDENERNGLVGGRGQVADVFICGHDLSS